LDRNKEALTSKITSHIDAVRFRANSEAKYDLHFDLLHAKIKEYNVLPENTYNMDEKGFAIGVIGKSKRIFSKTSWLEKKQREAIQDGSREWMTLLAGVCADGSCLPLGLIFQSKNKLIRSAWVNDIQVKEHDVFVSLSPSGWTNNDIGIAWLEQVFQRRTRVKAGKKWRLLILDGHGSHVTKDFIDYCFQRRILLAIFPPHSIHSLQPLDVACFSPLARAYSTELSYHTMKSQGLIPVKKGDFFFLIWNKWRRCMTEKLVLKSFKATGIFPMDRAPNTNLLIFGPPFQRP
jgi:hypothetical protein